MKSGLRKKSKSKTKFVFVTGGVVSGLGKGITAASLGRLLKNRGYKVANQKLDPYLNVDPGTMSPYEHGEVFVTDDGAETDLDLGHYERFTDNNLTANSSITSGKIYSEVIILKIESKDRKNTSLTILVYSGFLSEISYTIWPEDIISSICSKSSGILRLNFKKIWCNDVISSE